jgi:hypothetical protein
LSPADFPATHPDVIASTSSIFAGDGKVGRQTLKHLGAGRLKKNAQSHYHNPKYKFIIKLSTTQSNNNPNPNTMTKMFYPKPLLVKGLQKSLDLVKNGCLIRYTTA